MNLRDPVTLDGKHEARIVGKSHLDYNVELADGTIKANVEPYRLIPRAAVKIVRKS